MRLTHHNTEHLIQQPYLEVTPLFCTLSFVCLFLIKNVTWGCAKHHKKRGTAPIATALAYTKLDQANTIYCPLSSLGAYLCITSLLAPSLFQLLQSTWFDSNVLLFLFSERQAVCFPTPQTLGPSPLVISMEPMSTSCAAPGHTQLQRKVFSYSQHTDLIYWHWNPLNQEDLEEICLYFSLPKI